MTVVRLPSNQIVIRCYGEYREAGGAAPILGQLAATGGFLFVSPFTAAGAIEFNIQRFHRTHGIFRKRVRARAFWLIGVTATAAAKAVVCLSRGYDGGAAPTALDGSPSAFEPISGAFSYGWLFLQPKEISNELWLDAAQHLCGEMALEGFVVRANGGAAAAAHRSDGFVPHPAAAAPDLLAAFRCLLAIGPQGYSVSNRYMSATAAPEEAAVDLYAATPHCNSSAQMFAARGILSGWTG